MTRTNIFKRLLYPTQRASNYVKQVEWNMEYERLMRLCSDTGGESSPFFYRLQSHLDNNPTKGNDKHA